MMDPRKIGQFLMGEWNKTSQPLKERASVLPLGQYEDGSVGLAWPGLLAAPAEGVVNFGSQGFGDDAVPYNSRMAFDAAGGAMTGGFATGVAGGMVDNALGSAGGKLTQSASDLPMDLASRMARAKEMGFDTEKTWYHGTDREFSAFEPTRGASGAEGVYLTDNPELASFYAQARGDEGAQVLPVNVKSFGPFADYSQAADGSMSIAVPPNSIRSVNAAFDPAKSDSANLLAANAKSGASIPLALDAAERSQPMFKFGEKGLHVENVGNAEVTYGVNPANKTAELTLLRVPPKERGQGQARAALNAFVQEADANGYTLMLNADPLGGGGLSKGALEKFYKSAGFIRNAGKNKDFTTRAEYIRPPKVSANAPTGSALPLGLESQQQDQNPALLEYLKAIGLY